MSRKIAAFAACVAMFAISAGGAWAQTGSRVNRHPVKHADRCPVHRTPGGELVDCQGWRLRPNAIGWDNSCFHLDYLPSEFACSGGRR